MTFIEHDAMIQAFSPKAADNPLHMAVLPRTTVSDRKVLHAETEHALLKMIAIDPVAIPDEKAWRRIPRKSFNKLLRCPNRTFPLLPDARFQCRSERMLL